MPNYPYGSTEMFGRTIPLTKSGGLNQVFLNTSEKKLYNEYLSKLKEENKEQSLKELENFFKKK